MNLRSIVFLILLIQENFLLREQVYQNHFSIVALKNFVIHSKPFAN